MTGPSTVSAVIASRQLANKPVLQCSLLKAKDRRMMLLQTADDHQ